MSHKTLYWEDVEEGQELPPLTKEVTATTIIAGAFAFADFNPLHHDRDFAQKVGVPDIFMGMQVTTGWACKYLTNWAGPGSELKNIEFRLGATCFPGAEFVWNGKVVSK